MRQFFWAPKTYVLLMGKKIIATVCLTEPIWWFPSSMTQQKCYFLDGVLVFFAQLSFIFYISQTKISIWILSRFLSMLFTYSIGKNIFPGSEKCIHYKNKRNFTPNLVEAELPLIWCNLSTTLKAMFCSSVLIRRMPTTISDRYV